MNKNLLVGFWGLLLVFCVGFIGCTSAPPVTFDSIIADTAPTKFEGSWGHLNPSFENATVIFSGNSFIQKWDSGNINGLFTFDRKNITFLTADGKKWIVSYKLQDIELLLTNTGDGFRWYGGKFYKNVKKTFTKDDTSDVDFLVAKKLRDDTAALFFYDIDNDGNLDNDTGNTVKGQNELGGVCSDYAMELARLAEQEGLENYVATSGESPNNAIDKVTKWFDTNAYTFRVRRGRDFGVNNIINGHYDGVYRDADWEKVKTYNNNPPHVYGFPPANHAWNIVIINNRTFVIDATQFDEWGEKRNEDDYIAYILEAEGGI
ncbi:MAG: hypothetical protein LBP60_08405 [Spirochaetaceae bacterium]|jgi:hypothetical protein|nr:hypothetical protein [Spirochaetaceae bacterium]